MSVRCDQCGYENSDHYRFCGNCGAMLHAPAVPARTSALSPSAPMASPPKPPQTAPPPAVTGPSFLGLSDPPAKRDVEYLLQDEDDEPRSRHVGAFVVLILLLAGGGFAAWRWRANGYPGLDSLRQSSPVTSAPPSSTTTGLPPVGAAAAKGQAPSEPLAPSTSLSSQGPPPAVPNADEAHMTSPDEPVAGNSTEKSETSAGETQQAAPPAKNATPTGTNAAAENNNGDDSSSAAEETPPASSRTTVKPTSTRHNPASSPAKPSSSASDNPAAATSAATPAATSGDDRLVDDGEKYLYGNGVTQNCDRAQKNLKTAAGHSNPKAMSVLGTMYATGHCVDRDLPSAYRWFARALHLDPGNGRVQRDLEVLWRQMSADERQLAMRSSQ